MPEFNPVLVKELRGRMRGPRAFVMLSVYLMVLGGAMLLLYSAFASSNNADNLNAGREVGQALFYVAGIIALVQVCAITPLLTAGSIAGEKERETYDLLLGSLLSPWQIVWGKLGAALAYAALLVLAIVPMMSLAFLFGGVALPEVLIALVGIFVTAVLFAAIGLFWSTAMRTTLAASSLSIGSALLLLFGVPFIWFVGAIFFGSGSTSQITPTLVYIGAILLFLHPFIALGATETLIQDGRGYWVVTVPTSGESITIPSPWLIFVVLALLITIGLTLMSVRAIRPDAPVVARAPKAEPAKVNVEG
jgi:ABC-2 type transport system permease protein